MKHCPKERHHDENRSNHPFCNDCAFRLWWRHRWSTPYDQRDRASGVFLTYADPVPGLADWLNLNDDVLPAVERVTGCRYRGAPLPDNRIMGDMGVGNVPVTC